jgi:delta-aminolevulinic acid dehydratase/porphobilinogen synthase
MNKQNVSEAQQQQEQQEQHEPLSHNVETNISKEEKKKEDEERHIQEKLRQHAIQKMNKENENLILMTQNYQKYFENHCECSTIAVPSKILNNAKTNWMSSDKLNELRRKAHEAVRQHKVFILKGYFHTVRKALCDRGWVRIKFLIKIRIINCGV